MGMSEDLTFKRKELAESLLEEKENALREELDWVDSVRSRHNTTLTLNCFEREFHDQALEIIGCWNEAGELISMARKLIYRAKEAIDRHGWYFDGIDKMNRMKGILFEAKKMHGAIHKALRSVKFPGHVIKVGDKEPEC